MNDNKLAILTDSAPDVPLSLAEELGIEVIPLYIHIKETSFRDVFEISPKELYDKLEEEIPTTSIPSYGEIGDVYDRLKEEGFEEFLVVNIS